MPSGLSVKLDPLDPPFCGGVQGNRHGSPHAKRRGGQAVAVRGGGTERSEGPGPALAPPLSFPDSGLNVEE